jgi:hypothetical protein
VLQGLSYSVTFGSRFLFQASDVVAGLVPAIHALDARTASRSVARMRGGWVYIMTNRPNGTLYTGVTAGIARRA